MIIPIKCFTCGKVLADKYRYYLAEVHKLKLNDNPNIDSDKVVYLTDNNVKKTAEGKVLDQLGLTRYCCRRHMLCHVDID
jgi:DNA-directed RNA polymerase I, II, and III subunit RPABC5